MHLRERPSIISKISNSRAPKSLKPLIYLVRDRSLCEKSAKPRARGPYSDFVRKPISNTLPLAQLLHKEDRIIPHRFAADALHFTLTASTERIKPNTICFRLNQPFQAGAQLCIFRRRKLALKNAVLHPLPVRFEDAVNFGAAFIFGDIVTDDKKHTEFGVYLKINGGYLSVSPIRYFANSRACHSNACW